MVPKFIHSPKTNPLFTQIHPNIGTMLYHIWVLNLSFPAILTDHSDKKTARLPYGAHVCFLVCAGLSFGELRSLLIDFRNWEYEETYRLLDRQIAKICCTTPNAERHAG